MRYWRSFAATNLKMIKKTGIEIREISLQTDLEIQQILNDRWLENKTRHPRPQRPGLALAGYHRYLDKLRIQIFGKTEVGYLAQLEVPECEKRLRQFFAARIPALIISDGQPAQKNLVSAASRYHTSVLTSNLKTSVLVSRLSSFLYRHFSQKIRINGVLLDIKGVGTLLTGDSGIGKSESALELVNKGHQLVSDDLIEFYLDPYDRPVGRSIERIKQWIEVRGLGIINIVDIFGIGALLPEKKLDLVIKLEKWSPRKKYDRLGEGKLSFNILGKEIPMFIIPVAPGRNISTLVEVAVKYYMSRKNGSKSFIEYLDAQQNETEKRKTD